MKHDWKRDESGEIEPLDEDADHPVAQCKRCGVTSGCLHAIDFCTAIGEDPKLDADDCEGLDTNITVSLRISHPGQAGDIDDAATVAMTTLIPLKQVLDAKRDPVVSALGELAEVMDGSWRGARTIYEPAWRAAVSAAASSPVSAEETS